MLLLQLLFAERACQSCSARNSGFSLLCRPTRTQDDPDVALTSPSLRRLACSRSQRIQSTVWAKRRFGDLRLSSGILQKNIPSATGKSLRERVTQVSRRGRGICCCLSASGSGALIPPAIESGLGELGKHGSLVSSKFRAGFRLAAITTNMPLIATKPVEFGADQFGDTCQICTRECPPNAISPEKRLVRGVKRGYVDFDKIPKRFGRQRVAAKMHYQGTVRPR